MFHRNQSIHNEPMDREITKGNICSDVTPFPKEDLGTKNAGKHHSSVPSLRKVRDCGNI